MAETVYDRAKTGNPAVDFNIKETMDRWRTGVKRKQRGIASFRERIAFRMDAIEAWVFPQVAVLEEWQKRECVYQGPGRYEFIDAEWRPIRLGETWGDAGRTAFFRRRAEVPEAFAGRRLLLRIYVGGDGLLRVGGEPFHGVDPFHNEVLLSEEAEGGVALDLEVESYVAWHAEKRYPHTFALAELAVEDPEVRAVWWDFLAAIKALDIEAIDPKLETFLGERIWEALKRVPLQESDDGAMRRAILAAGRTLRQDLYQDDRFQGAGLMHLVGHSHLDLVFMWPYREYLRKVARTHSTMLRLMEQYPEFKFCQSQAKIYADMKAHWPGLYEQVKRRVREGRWEPIGAFWVEPDCNLISGESFVRQILYGQKFFQEEFGLRSRTCWQPDVFGLSWAMPQILARGGIEYFLSNKMSTWNDTNPWRKHTFWWEGMDGSRVLGIVPPGHFIGTVDPDIMDRQWRDFADKETVGETLHVYGWGDGGAGPDPEMIECGRRYADFPGMVRTRFSAAEEAFDSIGEKAGAADDLPVIRDEIYLEAHRGTYTNKGRLKKINRRLEILLRDAELAASLASLLGAAYPAAALRETWQDLLTSQFHDALPGTHVPEVYAEMLADYERIRAAGQEVLGAGLGAVLGPEAPPGTAAEGAPLLAVNTLLHARGDWLAVPAERVGERLIADSEGRPLPQQRVRDLEGAEKVLVRVPEVPPVGYRALRLVSGEAPAPAQPAVTAADGTLENALLRAEFDADGRLVSLYDKEHDREVLVEGAAGNRFQMYEDTPGHYEAWDIAATYVEHEIDVSGGGTLRVEETGPVRASLLLEKPLADSTVRQRISLAADSRLLVFETEIRWVERQRLLKVAFPVEVNTREAVYDIAFGNIARPTHANTPFDAAKFEVPANFWADLSQGDYGVSLLNDSKYGYDARGKVLRLTLLKGATYPDPDADKETHHFAYVLYPHAGTWREAGTNEAGLNLNHPLRAYLPAEAPAEPAHSYLETTARGVTLEAVKGAEDGRGLIVRLVERAGALARGRLRFDRPVRRAWTCNLLEDDEAELAVEDGEVALRARPYEILTIRAVC